MQDRRVDKGVQRGARFEIEVDGRTMVAHEGETVAAVLLAAGKKIFRTTSNRGRPRGLYCGIGLCHDCLVVFNGEPNVQACQTLVSPGCRIDTQTGLEDWEAAS